MRTPILIIALFISMIGKGQLGSTYKIRTIAFYNVENLFDTVNDSLTFDDDRTPLGKDQWTLARYYKKINAISQVLSEIGADISKTTPDIIGLCEIENKQVLEDLVDRPVLKNKAYGIVHFQSPDERGIDVALLYKMSAFIPDSFASHRLLLFDQHDQRDRTRDQLVVGGWLDGEKVFFIVNHWPSRSGGELKSRPYRLAASKLNKRIIDSLYTFHSGAKIFSMGDFNDDPVDPSLKKVISPAYQKKETTNLTLYNPFEKLYKMGFGSLAYRDKWNLFDQIFFTKNLIDPKNGSYRFWKAGIYNPSYMVAQEGPYKGYPFRTYSGGAYTGGYSDHFPVFIYLIRPED